MDDEGSIEISQAFLYLQKVLTAKYRPGTSVLRCSPGSAFLPLIEVPFHFSYQMLSINYTLSPIYHRLLWTLTLGIPDASFKRPDKRRKIWLIKEWHTHPICVTSMYNSVKRRFPETACPELPHVSNVYNKSSNYGRNRDPGVAGAMKDLQRGWRGCGSEKKGEEAVVRVLAAGDAARGS
jgi:hypothetical protein